MVRSVVIYEDDGWFVAEDILSGVASQGRTIAEASRNVIEAVELYFEGSEGNEDNAEEQNVFFTTMEVVVQWQLFKYRF